MRKESEHRVNFTTITRQYPLIKNQNKSSALLNDFLFIV